MRKIVEVIKPNITKNFGRYTFPFSAFLGCLKKARTPLTMIGIIKKLKKINWNVLWGKRESIYCFNIIIYTIFSNLSLSVLLQILSISSKSSLEYSILSKFPKNNLNDVILKTKISNNTTAINKNNIFEYF